MTKWDERCRTLSPSTCIHCRRMSVEGGATIRWQRLCQGPLVLCPIVIAMRVCPVDRTSATRESAFPNLRISRDVRYQLYTWMSEASLARLQRALDDRWVIRSVAGAGSLPAATADIAVLAVDPSYRPEQAGNLWKSFADGRQSSILAVLAYMPLRADAVRSLLQCARPPMDAVVFAGLDDRPAQLRTTLAALVGNAPTRLLWARIARQMRDGPTRLVAVLEEHYTRTPRHSVRDAIADSGMSRRSVERHVARCGFRSLRLLVAAPRALAAWQVLHRPDTSRQRAARDTGFRSVRGLNRAFRYLLGSDRHDHICALPLPDVLDLIESSLLAGKPTDPRANR